MLEDVRVAIRTVEGQATIAWVVFRQGDMVTVTDDAGRRSIRLGHEPTAMLAVRADAVYALWDGAQTGDLPDWEKMTRFYYPPLLALAPGRRGKARGRL